MNPTLQSLSALLVIYACIMFFKSIRCAFKSSFLSSKTLLIFLKINVYFDTAWSALNGIFQENLHYENPLSTINIFQRVNVVSYAVARNVASKSCLFLVMLIGKTIYNNNENMKWTLYPLIGRCSNSKICVEDICGSSPVLPTKLVQVQYTAAVK